MRSAKNIEKLIKNLDLDIDTNAKTDGRILSELFEAQQRSKQTSAKARPNIWRIIMKSRITKLAAAAMVAVGIMWSITLFDGSLSPAFAIDDVWAATAKAEWVHVTWQYTEQNIEPTDVTKQLAEIWMSVKPHRVLEIYKDGTVAFAEHNEATGQINTHYDPQTNTVTSIYRCMKKGSSPPATIADVFFGGFSEAEDEGAKVEYIDSFYGDDPVKIINIDHRDDNGVHAQLSLMADARTFLPISMTSLQEEPGKSTTANIIFDYPKTGPTDIYQVGVPPDIEVKIIDYRPSPQFLQAIRPYRAARNNLPKQRVVVEVAKENDARSRVSVVYTSDIKERFEQLKCKKGDTPPETDDLETILDWANGVREGELGIQLNDGTMVYCANRDLFCRWTSKTMPGLSYKVGFVPSGLTHRGWPKIDLGKPIENDYAIDNGFLCIETVREPSFADTKLAESAEKTLYYLDPKHDYMCVYMESFRHPVLPPWSNPQVNGVDIDPYDIPSEPYLITEVVELSQADTGHWYPSRTIITNKQSWTDKGSGWQMREKTFDVRLYVDGNPEFVDGIFDPENLPK